MSIEQKPKPCKGTGKAISVKGCGTKTLWRRYGLCPDCLADFLFGTDAGKILMQKSIIPKAKRQEQGGHFISRGLTPSVKISLR